MNVQAIETLPPHSSVPVSAVALTPMDLLNRALSQGAGMEVIEKFMSLQERWEKNQARKTFDKAIAAAKAEVKPIIKNKQGHNGKYADLAAIDEAITPILSKHGLHYRFRSTQTEKGISITCILSHDDGYFEETTLSGNPDVSGNKNAIQAIGSAATYLSRYTLRLAVGLSATDDDDGKASGAPETIMDDQIKAIRALIMETKSNETAFLKYMGVEKVDDITTARYADAIRALNAKRGAGK